MSLFLTLNQRKTSTFKKATTTVMLIGAFSKDVEDRGEERRGLRREEKNEESGEDEKRGEKRRRGD